MKKRTLIFGSVLAICCIFFGACRTRTPEEMETREKLRLEKEESRALAKIIKAGNGAHLVHVRANLRAKEGFGKKYFVVPDKRLTSAKTGYEQICKDALIRGMNFKGFELAAKESDADFKLTFFFETQDEGRRMSTVLTVEAVSAKNPEQKLWDATSVCTSRPSEKYDNYLPGLAAGALLYFDKNHGGVTKLVNYPKLTAAVMGVNLK